MLGWFQALMPKEDRFFDLFERHAQILVEGAGALRDVLDGGANAPLNCVKVAQLENEADAVAREVLLAVRRTFITPFDRSDIRDLINDMDDAIDQMHQTTKAITLYEVTAFEPLMGQLGDLIVQAAQLTAQSAPLLRAINANASKLAVAGEEMSRLEELSDQLHDQGIKELYRQHRQLDPMAYIVGAEIYGHLEKVVDGFEDVANRIGAIVLEHI